MSSNDTQASDVQDPTKDTPEQQDQSKAGELENQTPEANQEEEVKETSETDVNATDTAEKLLAGKYKTPEDLEKAYKELESRFGKESSEKAELSKVLNEVMTPSEEDTASTSEDLEYSADDKVQRDMAVLKFIISHGDANAENMKKVLAEDPMVSQINSHEAKLEYAYLRAKDATSSQAMNEAQKVAQDEAKAKIAEKEGAQVESAKKAEPTDEGADLLSKATEGTPDERKAARNALIRKHLTNL